MVTIDADATTRDGVTFVAAVVANDRSTAQRVRLENAIPGPTWPPRRDGVVATAWSDDEWEATVGPNSIRGVGYATPGDPVDDPLEVRSVERATGDETARGPRHVLATHPDPAPPREALSGRR